MPIEIRKIMKDEDDGIWKNLVRFFLGPDWYESDQKQRFEEFRQSRDRIIFWVFVVVAAIWFFSPIGSGFCC